MDAIRSLIAKTMEEIAKEFGSDLNELRDDTVLLSSGLSSLGFAVLVVRLEEKLGYDPFLLDSEAIYPNTFIELVEYYQKWKP